MTAATDMLSIVCKRNPAVEQCMEQSQKEHSGGKNQLRDILSVPMQRILKYHLLLDKLVEKTSPVSECQIIHSDEFNNSCGNYKIEYGFGIDARRLSRPRTS